MCFDFPEDNESEEKSFHINQCCTVVSLSFSLIFSFSFFSFSRIFHTIMKEILKNIPKREAKTLLFVDFKVIISRFKSDVSPAG